MLPSMTRGRQQFGGRVDAAIPQDDSGRFVAEIEAVELRKARPQFRIRCRRLPILTTRHQFSGGPCDGTLMQSQQSAPRCPIMSQDQHSFRKLLPGFVISAGTQVVLKVAKTLADGQQLKPPGSVGVVLQSPTDIRSRSRARPQQPSKTL